MSQTFTVTMTCGNGHVQQVVYSGVARAFVEGVAGLMDGTSPMYVHPPGPDSVIGKCGICRAWLKAKVEDGDRRVAAPDAPPIEVTRGQYGEVTLSTKDVTDAVAKPPKVAPVEGTLTTDRGDPRLRETRADGQQGAYLVLSEEERAKGFVRPVRRKYKHLACGTVTTMGQAIAETYARDPGYYSGTFCCHCGKHFPLSDGNRHAFVWDGDGSPVGS